MAGEVRVTCSTSVDMTTKLWLNIRAFPSLCPYDMFALISHAAVAYYHSMYETLGSIIYALDLLVRHGDDRGGTNSSTASTPQGDHARLLDNMCIPAEGSQIFMVRATGLSVSRHAQACVWLLG